jgi:hypothetical protein
MFNWKVLKRNILLQMAGEVFSVDEDHFVAEAKKHAELNGITGCQYFGGKPEEVLPTIAPKITCNKACAIVISTSNHFSTCELFVLSKCDTFCLLCKH